MENFNKNCDLNIFYFNSGDNPNSCGYCKKDGEKSKTSYSFGFSSDKLTPDLYEDLMFLGWRRCGDYVYRPNLEKSCCKLYSTRLDIGRFKINKNQKRVMKNFRKFLIGEEIKKNVVSDVEMTTTEEILDKYEIQIKEVVKKFLSSKMFLEQINHIPINSDLKVIRNKKSNLGDYSTNFLITTYHNVKTRLGSEIQKFKTQNEFFINIWESFLNYINSEEPNFTGMWNINISEKTGHINLFIKEEKKEEMLAHHYMLNQKSKPMIKENKKQKIIEKSDEYKLEYIDEIIKEPIISNKEIKHKYSIELEPNSKFSEEKFIVYKKYQMAIHKDKEQDLTPDRYIDAWGSTNLVKKQFNLSNTNNLLFPSHLGTWDLIHKIDGKIFAVGILDILPTSVSSVYLYYDPEYSFLNPGVYTAIREIELVKEFNKHLDSKFKYYVMGFYCHSCPKMKYKGDYYPTEILCPVTFNFVDLEKVITEIVTNKYVIISKEAVKPEMVMSRDQIKAIMKSFSLTYENRNFNLIAFVKDYIEEHSSNLLKYLEDLVILVGKENIRNFKFYVT